MKRSEAIDIVEKYLAAFYNVGPVDTHKDAATELLQLLETKGICPPLTAVPVETHYMDAAGVIRRGEDSKVFVHKWEPEDV